MPNGTFEMRAAVFNPTGATLQAIARQAGTSSAHARIEGSELVMLFSPDPNQTLVNPLIAVGFRVAVSDGEVAIERSYGAGTVDLTLFKAGFE